MVLLILNEPSLLSSSCLHFKEVLILMNTDEKMKKNSSGFTEKAYCLERNFIWQNWPTVHRLILTDKRSVDEVSRGGFSSNKKIKAV